LARCLSLIDPTNCGDIVIGSCSTRIAAEKPFGVCRGIELNQLYIDVIVCRYGLHRRGRYAHRGQRDLRRAGGAGSARRQDPDLAALLRKY
jgi:hypothetical protein